MFALRGAQTYVCAPQGANMFALPRGDRPGNSVQSVQSVQFSFLAGRLAGVQTCLRPGER